MFLHTAIARFFFGVGCCLAGFPATARDLRARYPQVFAAGISMCGAGKATTAKNFAAASALWLFHGSSDDVISVSYPRDYYKRLQKLGADVRYTEYAGVGYNCWERAFKEPGLLAWLFSKQKK